MRFFFNHFLSHWMNKFGRPRFLPIRLSCLLCVLDTQVSRLESARARDRRDLEDLVGQLSARLGDVQVHVQGTCGEACFAPRRWGTGGLPGRAL